MGRTIEISTLEGDQRFGAYRAEPGGQTSGAVILIPEIFGINAGVRAKCDAWAALGYLAIAPDLFWRFEPGVERDPDVSAEFDAALAAMQRFDVDLGVRDIEAAVREARALGGGKVAAVGFCLGGKLAFLAATRTDVDASVGYYAVGLEALLHETHAIARPLMLHIAGADHFSSGEARATVHAALDDHSKVVLHDYPGLDHGFATERGSRRDEAGAQLSDERTRAFVEQALA